MKLGCEQLGCLRSLVEDGAYPGGWIWGNRSRTLRVLNSLVKRGLVEQAVWTLTRRSERLGDFVVEQRTKYVPTDAGREVVYASFPSLRRQKPEVKP